MARTGRNDACPCGSGRKFKKCCERKVSGSARQSRILLLVVGGVTLAAIAAGILTFRGGANASAPGRVWSTAHGHYHDAGGREIP